MRVHIIKYPFVDPREFILLLLQHFVLNWYLVLTDEFLKLGVSFQPVYKRSSHTYGELKTISKIFSSKFLRVVNVHSYLCTHVQKFIYLTEWHACTDDIPWSSHAFSHWRHCGPTKRIQDFTPFFLAGKASARNNMVLHFSHITKQLLELLSSQFT